MESTQALMGSYLDALTSNGDFGPYLADDIVFRMPDVGIEIQGKQDVIATIIDWHQNIFDARIEVVDVIVAGEKAAAEVVFHATQMREFLGIPATGKSVRAPYTAFYEVRAGKIAAIRVYGVIPTIVMQLTADQAPAAATPAT
jgi:steroid delta-isomerase-like uncharacterized protein